MPYMNGNMFAYKSQLSVTWSSLTQAVHSLAFQCNVNGCCGQKNFTLKPRLVLYDALKCFGLFKIPNRSHSLRPVTRSHSTIKAFGWVLLSTRRQRFHFITSSLSGLQSNNAPVVA